MNHSKRILFAAFAGLLCLTQTSSVCGQNLDSSTNSDSDDLWADAATSHPQPWPDKKETRETLARCSAMLSVAVDTNKVQADAVRITNEVLKADVLRLAKEAKSF